MKRRVLSLVTTLALCLNLCPVWVLAAGEGTAGGLCPHHPAHTDECGYAPPVLEQECAHTHDDSCYTTEISCVHEHTAECYPNPDDSSEADEPALCAHVCTEDSGCVTRTLDCPHEHDEACGYVPGDPGAPCTFVCKICPIEELIGQLPGSVSEDNSEQVGEQLEEIYALYGELTDEEQQQVDLSPCLALLDQIEGMEAAVQSDTSGEGRTTPDGIYTLKGDETFDTPYEVSKSMIIDTKGFTLTGTGTSGVQVNENGVLELRGRVVGEYEAGVEVKTGGSLTITEEGTNVWGELYGLKLAAKTTVKLSAGRYFGNIAAIQAEDGNYTALLAPGYIFFDENGSPIPAEDMAKANTVVVGQCTDHQKVYTHNSGTPTHTWTCSACRTSGTEEKCTFDFAQDGGGTSSCGSCGNSLSIGVNQDDLSGLVYDGTVKPEEVRVTVTLTDPDGDSTPLVRDTDFEVNIEKITNAGQAKVTVTGKTFNGTFVRTYTVEQDKPGLSWANSNPVTVNYDGQPVEANDLPAVNINIQSQVDDLRGYLQYSHKKQSDTDYISGLPTDADTYDVIVSLPELPNFEGAVSDPITLTINPINPIVTAPEATKPTYNRSPQELVTAGELNPVAMADGLEIKFATEENGTYSTTIPAGTDAGDYTVWYQVTGLTGNYIAPNSNPAQVSDVKILRKSITPVVTLSQYSYLYDGGWKEPAVTVKDEDHVTVLLDTEYQVEYQDNRNVGTAKVIVTDSDVNGGNYDLQPVTEEFEITSKTQEALSITNQPSTFTYGDKFVLGTSGGSGNGDVTWEITNGKDSVATVGQSSGQVIITGHGDFTVKATKSGKDPDTGVVNYEDATASLTFTADKKPVTATVTAEDKDYDGNANATVHAVVESGVLAGDEVTITGLTGTFDDENAGVDKTVTVVTTGATITGNNSQHYAVSYSSTTVKATIHKAVAQITAAPVPASLTYNGTAQELINTGAVVAPNTVSAEYALSEDGPYSTDFPKGTNAGDYTVWYRIKETDNYTGLAPASVEATINKKPVSPTITLDQDTFVYDGTEKKPTVTLYEGSAKTVTIPAGEYAVEYSNNINVSTADTPATVTVTAKADGNYSFTPDPVTKDFTISQKQAQVLTAPKPAGDHLIFKAYDQELVIPGTAEGGTMVYRVGDTGDFEPDIPKETNAGIYKVYYKVKGDSNHSDSEVCAEPVTVIIDPKVVNNPTIELQNDDGTSFQSCVYNSNPWTPKVVVKDGSTVISHSDNEYKVVYSNNTDAGTATVSITDNPGGNYTVTGSTSFVIDRVDIVDPKPQAAHLTYSGTAQPLLLPGTTSGGTVYYALDTSTSEYHDYIPTGVNAGVYKVYYKVTGDKNHKDFPITEVTVTIGRKSLTAPTIELTPNSFEYDGAVHLPAVTVKDGDTVLPASEYTWKCYDASGTNEVSEPKDGGTYTVTISDKTGGNYDLTGAATANKNTADFTIGKAAQAELTIDGKRDPVYYGDSFQLTASGGSSTGDVTWSATGAATVDVSGNVTINNVGEVTISVVKDGDTNYEQTSAQWTFTAAPKPVTASVTVNNKPYDGTTTATVTSADITADLVTVNGTTDTVTIDPASITAVFDDPHAGTGKTVTLDTSNVQVTGDDAVKYAISYPDTVKADITQATTTIGTAPEKIDPLTYSGQPQALVTAGQTNVGFLVYSLSENGEYSREIPTGTDASTYTVYYKVDGTADYTGVAANTTPISVTIDPKPITSTVKVELSETSFKYDGTKKTPKVTLKDGDTVIPESQYTVTWAGTKSQTDADMLRVADTYTATIENVTSGNNYTFSVTDTVEITPAEQAALHITGYPEHVYYGDVITTLSTTGGTGEGTVKWSVTAGSATIEDTGKLTITGTGSVTVKAERTVPNYGTVSDTWPFTVEPKPVVAEVTVAAKTYDGTTDIAAGDITATVSDLVAPGDAFTISDLTGAYEDANVGTGKTVILDSTNAATTADTDKYAVSYPTTVKGDINPKSVTVTVTLSDHDLQGNATDGYYYEYDGTEKKPTVIVTADDGAVLKSSDYEVGYANNKNVSTATVKATVTVTAKADGNYTFTAPPVNFEICSAAAVLVSSPLPKDLTYEKGTEQELVTVGTATGGTVVYSLTDVEADYKEEIPKKEAAGTYTVYYKVKGDANHVGTAPQAVFATIKPKQITPAITLDTTSYVYDGTAKTPTVTVKDGNDEIPGPNADKPEYAVSYRDNINAGTATVTVSNATGGNYIVNGTATFEITKKAPTVTAPTEIPGLYYTGEVQELVTAGVTSHGTVVYSVNGGNYSAAIPTASAVGTYSISWKVQGDGNHSDTDPATLSVEIAKNTVTNPTITLSQDQFTYDNNQHKPDIAVYDNNSRLIPAHEYTATITGTNGNVGMVNVDTYTVTIAAAANSNYEFAGTLTRTFKIVPADQETISITGTRAQVRYGDTIQLGVSGGTGSGTVKWEITGNTDTTLTQGGLLTVKDVNTPIKVTVTRSRGGNYTDVSATWEFTAAKKPVTAEVTVAAKDYDGNTSVASTAITATVKAADLAFTGDSITITGLTGEFDNPNVGTGKTVTLTGGTVDIANSTNADKYDVTIPATATASILGVAATVDTAPSVKSLTYDASQSQELVTAGTATGGTMVYSLDGTNFTPNIPKGKDAGSYKVYYKAQGDQNHTDSAVGTVDVIIDKQTVMPQIELSPPSGQYDGKVQQPAVTVRDTANNVIPTSEYKVTYVTDGGKNWTDQGTYTVKVENITGGNYEINTATADFVISTSAQAPLEIVNKPGLVYYSDTFTLSATGGSGSSAVTWSSSDENIAHIDDNGLVTIKGTGSATITATKAGGGNYDTATATYPLNALKKPVTATVTADDKVYDGKTDATIHVTWNGLVGSDEINTDNLTGTFEDANVGTNKKVTITGDPVSDATSQKYDFTIHRTTTASITKAVATAPVLTANNREYDGTAKDLVTGGDANTLYSTSRDGVYSDTVPTGTNAGTYTVWYKEQGDANHNDSEPQAIEVTISPKTLTLTATDIELSGSDLKTDTSVTPNVYYYEYDGTDKTPSVVIKDGAATVPASEYTVTYSDNRNVSTADKKATVTITDNEGGNYIVSGSTTFEIRAGSAQLTSSPQAKDLTYTRTALELVTVGTATGGHLEYKLTSVPAGEPAPTGSFSTNIPTGTNAGTYTVDYKVVGDDNHTDGPTGSVTVIIQPKTVVSPKITVNGGPFIYNSNAHEPTVTVVDGTDTIDTSEYTLSYQNNVNVGTATVIVIDNNGGNYTVNGTATFEIGKAAAAVGTAPTGKTGLKYNGTAQELLDKKGTATGGTLVYSLVEDGEYSAAIPTGKDVGSYTVYYKVQGDGNHNDSAAQSVSASIAVNTVTNPKIQVTPPTVKYTGERQEPTVTVRDDDDLLINGSEYTVTYEDTANNNTDLTAVGTYTVTVTGKGTNYSFSKTATFTITPADQTALTITGTRERVYYGDTIPLGTTGGDGTVTWTVDNSSAASINASGLLNITGTGSVTVTATSSKTGYANQTDTWQLYAEKKPATAVVTAVADKTYDGIVPATTEVTAKLQSGDLVDSDDITITLTGTFDDPNAGTDKRVSIDRTTANLAGTNSANYKITYPVTTTGTILKADIETANVQAPTAETGLTYTGLPLTLVTAGTVTEGGTMEYSTDNVTYSTALPTGTDAKAYDVWYRVKGDGNHKDTEGVKLGTQVTIVPQTVDADKLTIEFTPSGASYDGQVHKPAVIVKDGHNRVIPAEEYTVTYSDTDWKTASSATVKHVVTITDKDGGNYQFAPKTVEFTISMMGQNPLSITNQPGEVRYGDSFTLGTTGGSGTGAVTWTSSDTSVATIGTNGLVKTLKSGATTITATKEADANYGAVSVTWALSVERKPVTPVVTARNKPYDSNTTATLDVSWKPGDLLGNDSITLSLTGAFDDANVGENKTVRITGTPPDDDRYAVTIPSITTASITAQAATVSGVQSGPWTYTGSEISLLQSGAATNGTIVYSRNGVDFMETSPTETNAGRYTVYYKARGNTNYADSDVRMVEVTIQPKTVSSPTIELSQETFTYDGTAKRPDVVVKDGTVVIPASEYTVSYSNNINVGTDTAKVTITDNPGGNYTVSGSQTFTITAGAVSLTSPPQAKDLTYNGFDQALVTPGTAANGSVVYSTSQTGTYTSTIPTGQDAKFYQVWYKAKGDGGETAPESMIVEIKPRPVTAILTLSSTSLTYTGSALTPTVTVSANGQTLDASTYQTVYSNNTEPGTATVTVTSIGGNYQFTAQTTFTITKAKAAFLLEPEAKTGLVYTGQPQELIEENTGISLDGIVLYSTDAVNFSAAVPTATKVSSRHLVIAKVQGNSTHADSDPVVLYVEIAKNDKGATVVLESESTNFPYTGNAQRPPVTVLDSEGNVIDSGEYTLSYSDNINVGEATVTASSKSSGNYSFTASTTFTIVDASQAPLAITGKPEGTVYYGDTLSLGTTGGGNGTVAWSATGPVDRLGDGQYKVNSSGSVTITATKGSSTDSWTFVAKAKPVTATVYAADKVYDGDNTVKLTVSLSGLLPGDNVTTVTANGSFMDANAGTDKTVLITGLNGLDGIKDKYTVTYNNTTTASITPKPASVTGGSVTGKNLTYNGTEQALVDAAGVTVEGGSLAYSLGSSSFDFNVPTGKDAGSYTVYYKVVADGSGNYRDGAMGSVTATISANVDTPTVLCTPSTIQYDGTEKTPDVVVRDSQQRIIPASEYTVTLPTPRIAVDTYTVTVTDKAGGNYDFTNPVTGTFQIVASSQNPLSITDVPSKVCYGDTFRLSAIGGSGSGAVQWSIPESSVATIDANGFVTVKDTGGFTVKAYRAASDGYSDSNTDSVPLVAQPKPVTPVVTASDKSYNGNTDAALTASIRPGDKVKDADEVILTVNGVFASADAGVGKRVDLTTYTVGGADAAKYTINWPDSVTATINRVDAKIAAAPAPISGLREDGTAHQLVSPGMTENDIGTVEYRLDQDSAYSTEIPTGTTAGTYRVWYQVADSVNYVGVAPAYVDVVIAVAASNSDSNDSDSGTDTSFSMREPEGTNTKLSVEEGSALVQEAVDNQSETIVIQPEVASDATEAAVSIPAETVGKISSETSADLTVSTPIADVTIPNAGLDTLSGQEGAAGDVGVAVTRQEDGAVVLTLVGADGETVSEVPGGVTLAVPAADATPGTVAVLVRENGAREVIRKSVAKDGTMIVPLSGSATVELVEVSREAVSEKFTDIQATDEAADAVAFVTARELFSGTSETTFSPEQDMSRSMLVTVLYTLEGRPNQESTSEYSDVSEDDWYAASVAWATEKGIVSGYDDSQFGPGNPITQEQFALVLWRYAGSPAASGSQEFEGANAYAQDALRWAAEKNILSGGTDPKQTVNRVQAAQMLKNFMEST